MLLHSVYLIRLPLRLLDLLPRLELFLPEQGDPVRQLLRLLLGLLAFMQDIGERLLADLIGHRDQVSG